MLTNYVNNLNVNSMLFLDYIKSFGFNPKNYGNIIEVNGGAKESVSQFLNHQYLISKQVVESDLKELGINGSNGYISETGLIAQNDKESNILYAPIRGIHQEYKKGYPRITEDDVIIANGINPYMNNLSEYKQDKYIGFCMDFEDPELVTTYYRFRDLQNILNKNKEEYVLEHDSLSHKGKAMLLLRKKTR